MSVAACPTADALAAFARGDLPAGELAAFAGHVGACAACCRALKLLPEDPLAGLARAAAAEPTELEVTNLSPRQPGHAPPPTEPGAREIPAGFADHPRYRILGQLGAGGMGTVYKAEDLLMGRAVAIKVVAPHLTADAGAVERFRREIRVAAQLNDPRAIIAHDTGEAGGRHFLVMEFVEGISLDRLVARKGPLPVQMACSFARQAALGLQHAADRGMIHRDIKPQNLMVTRKGQVKILDFGLARFAGGDEGGEAEAGGRLPFGAARRKAGGVTNPNFVMGTPDYLSPEQARDSHDVDHRSDIYSLGCTLYFLLTAAPPFLGAATFADKLFAHAEDEPPPVREARPDVPEALAGVMARMMAKRLEDRYQPGAEVAAALQPFARANAGAGAAAEPAFEIVEAVAVTPAPRAGPASDTAPPPGSATLTEAPRGKRPKKKKKRAPWWKRRGWALAGGAALLLAVGIAVAIAAGRKPAERHADSGPAGGPGAKESSRPAAPAAGKGGKSREWVPPTVIAPPKDELLVLVVVPSQGVWMPDYDTVRAALTAPRPGKRPVRVEAAAARGDRARPAAGSPGPPDGVAIDVRLSESTGLAKYSAVVFVGFNVDEYVSGAGRRAAEHAVKEMQAARKPVASICTGQAVLAAHGALKGRKAAPPPPGFDAKFRDALSDPSIRWQKWPVAADDSGGKPVITAAGPPQAREFADEILRAIEK
jgi:serine/threonine-protein kinase